jgi:hypothetical protein
MAERITQATCNGRNVMHTNARLARILQFANLNPPASIAESKNLDNLAMPIDGFSQ